MHFLYSLGLAVLLVITSPVWLWKLLRQGKYRAGLRERLGAVPARITAQPVKGAIWIHAVSVGEVLAVGGLVQSLRRKFPERRIVVSTTTATGQALARQRFGEANVFYFPLDFTFAIRAYLHVLQPRLVVLAETEFWPNFLRLCRQSGALMVVVNARISDHSFPRYLRFHFLMRRILRAVDLFLSQTSEDARRLIEIGAPEDRVRVGGNLKFDTAPPQRVPVAEELKRRFAESGAFPVLVCGSTVEGEEGVLLATFQEVRRRHPNVVMVLAPRHPERFDEVASLVNGILGMRLWRRSQFPADELLRGGVLLLDSIGELASVYSVATIAVVGGSLAPRGGHNILEPAFFGVPILVGPYTENFRDIVAAFRERDAVRVVRAFSERGEEANLTQVILQLVEDNAEREAMGRRAAETLRSLMGATEHTLSCLESLLAGANAREVVPQ